MSDSDKPKAQKPDSKAADKTAISPQPAAKASEPAPALPQQPPPLDERRLTLAELLPFAKQLDADNLIELARDGRATVRANAALGLAAVGHPAFELVTLVRDSEPHVAVAAAEAFAKLGPQLRERIPQLVAALDGALPEVLDAVVGTLSELIGSCDAELTAALDVPEALALKTVISAAGRLGPRGIAFLARATAHDRSRVRVNAIAGLGRLGKADADAAMACLTVIEGNDPVPDVRTAAKQAMLSVVAREKTTVVDSLPKIPDFEARKLSKGELMESADAIDVDQMIHALEDGRAHVKINATRALAIKGEKAARGASALGLLLRDSVPAVRREAAIALGKLGTGAAGAANDLVGALGDPEADVVEAAGETIAGLGPTAREALVRGLDAGTEIHGLRVGELIGKLPDAARTLVEAFASPAVNVQVNAALGLGLLRDKVGSGLASLHGARTGGDARTRDAVRRALEMIDPKGDSGPQAIAIEGFEDRFLGAADVETAKASIEKVGVTALIAHLTDGRDVVRANAATALGSLGSTDAAPSLGVRLRDDSPRVRLAAAQALDRIGDAAVTSAAADLVGALRDADVKVAEACAAILKGRKSKMIGALVRGLETDDPRHGRRIVEVIGALGDASEILTDAFDSPAVNVQVNAALGLGLLGNDRVGKGRRALEGARTGGWERTREAVRAALDVLDGPPAAGPAAIDIEGFEARHLAAEAFKNDGAKSLPVDDLAGYLTDGRAVVRANAATALGVIGAPALGAVRPLGVLLKDDDSKVRIAAAGALDKLGDDAVREIAEYLVGALRGDAEVAAACAPVLIARKTKVLTALLKGLETDDDIHARRILEVIMALPDAAEILIDAIESPAENVQVNAAIGIGMLGAKRAGAAGRKTLESRRTGGFPRTREAVFKGLALLDG
ncbi:MAG: HEAT repeat domain-containing protein [Deltaproteobacteria bacterium]|nr:HEAT repeat domain-containing protein [Deltaproteobacteria bacterium]